MHGLGYIQDEPDERDHDAARVVQLVSAPSTVASNRRLVRILSQGALGSCVLNSSGQAIRAMQILQQVRDGVGLDDAQQKTPFMSRLFGYYNARSVHHAQGRDSGTYIRFAFQQFNKLGFCPEDAWPYSDDVDPETGPFTKMPPAEAFRLAYDQRLSEENGGNTVVKYSRIFDSGVARIDAIKRHVAEGRLVVFGTRVSEDFCNDNSANGLRPIDPPIGMKIVGGHAMCVGEYDGDTFGIANSWGTTYGDVGWCRFSADYLAWDETTDLWVVERCAQYQEAP